MSNYTKSTDFTAKDSLPSGDSQKVIRGSEFDTEFSAIATAVNSKADKSGDTVVLTAGTVSAPSLTTVSDTNTGIYFPAADKVAIATGGTQRVIVDDLGNVGIGTSSPGSRLDVQSASSANAYRVANIYNSAATGTTAGSNILLRVASNGSGADSTLVLTDSTATNGFISNNNGNLLFGNGLGFTERMCIDANGNLGLGVTPPPNTSYPGLFLQNSVSFIPYNGDGYLFYNAYSVGANQLRYRSSGLAATAYAFNQSGEHIWYNAPSGTAGNAISFTQAMTLNSSGSLVVGSTTANRAGANAGISVEGASTSILESNINASRAGFLYADAASTIVGEFRNFPLIFRTNDTERARITSGGYFLFSGLTTSAGNYWIQAKNTDSSSNCAYLENASGNDRGVLLLKHDQAAGATTGAMVVFQNSAGTTVGTITSSNTATAYNTSSDYRLKDNPQPLTGSGAFIDALQPKTWDWKTDGSRGVGFIAHEVQAVSPNSVVGTKDAVDAEGKPVMQGMEYGSAEFIANIVAELQSLRTRVATLENN